MWLPGVHLIPLLGENTMSKFLALIAAAGLILLLSLSSCSSMEVVIPGVEGSPDHPDIHIEAARIGVDGLGAYYWNLGALGHMRAGADVILVGGHVGLGGGLGVYGTPLWIEIPWIPHAGVELLPFLDVGVGIDLGIVSFGGSQQ